MSLAYNGTDLRYFKPPWDDENSFESQFRKIILDSSLTLPEELANFLKIDQDDESTSFDNCDF